MTAFGTSYQLALGEGRQLKMQPAKHAIAAAGFVVLHEVDVESGLFLELSCCV